MIFVEEMMRFVRAQFQGKKFAYEMMGTLGDRDGPVADWLYGKLMASFYGDRVPERADYAFMDFERGLSAVRASSFRAQALTRWTVSQLASFMCCPKKYKKGAAFHNAVMAKVSAKEGLSKDLLEGAMRSLSAPALMYLWKQSSKECLTRAYHMTSSMVDALAARPERAPEFFPLLMRTFSYPFDQTPSVAGVSDEGEDVILYVRPEAGTPRVGFACHNPITDFLYDRAFLVAEGVGLVHGNDKWAAPSFDYRMAAAAYELPVPASTDELLHITLGERDFQVFQAARAQKIPLRKALWRVMPADHPFQQIRNG